MIYCKDPPLTLSCNHESSEVVVKLRSTASVLKNKHTCARVCVCVYVCAYVLCLSLSLSLCAREHILYARDSSDCCRELGIARTSVPNKSSISP